MSAAPLAALPVGAAAGVVFWIASLAGTAPIVVAALTLAAIAVATRAMHLDGFADAVDGLGGGWTRERALEIMHRGDVGPMGVAGLVLLLLIQAGSLAQLISVPWSGVLVGALVCASRLGATLMCSTPVPPARESGMGAVVATSVPVPWALVVTFLTAVAVSAATVLGGLLWWSGLAATAALVLVVAGFGVGITRRFGGVTGDLLGAAIEIAFTVLLLTVTVLAH